MEKEIWKDIDGYEGLYQISNLGRVKRLQHKRYDRNQIMKEKIVKIIIPKNGWYPYISLCNKGIAKSKTIHRLIAKAFIPNPNNYPMINHIDGNKQNNNIDNLEWCDAYHNNMEAFRNGLNKPIDTRKKIKQLDLQGNLIKKWNSLTEASLNLKISKVNICKCCRKRVKTAGGYKWEYL